MSVSEPVLSLSHNVPPAAPVVLCDRSLQWRCGFKGPRAQEWGRNQGLPLPDVANTYKWDSGLLVLRLGLSEFLVEGLLETVDKVQQARRTPGVYSVARQDASFMVAGKEADTVLRQTCSVNFLDPKAGSHAVFLTTMIGVSVVVIRSTGLNGSVYTIWSDYTYGHYLSSTLYNIGRDLGGALIVRSHHAELVDFNGIFTMGTSE